MNPVYQITNRFMREVAPTVISGASGVIIGMILTSVDVKAVDFNTQVRPILSDHCFQCHGPDSQHRKANLRLDTPEGLFGGNHESAITDAEIVPVFPGNLNKSAIWGRIRSEDMDEIMPPPEANKPLNAQQVALIEKWISEGAPYESHWAFLTPEKPEIPRFSEKSEWNSWVKNPIDSFILRKMLDQGLEPSPEAPLNLLIRRVNLDLLGLPAPVEPLLSVLKHDSSKDKDFLYKEWVQKALASPHYGERMVWPWLDAARYADSNGYQADRERTMWPWRDWAIRALNDNMPFDQFTVYQIAGDLLKPENLGVKDLEPSPKPENLGVKDLEPSPKPENLGVKDLGPSPKAENLGVKDLEWALFEAKLATGFLRNHMINGEGGRIPEENRVDYVLDMTETVGTVWMGLTVGCSRCHDHKFDPISQKDYYALSGFFNQTPVNGGGGDPQTPPNLAVPDWLQRLQISDLKNKRDSLRNDLSQWEKSSVESISSDNDDPSEPSTDLPDNISRILKIHVSSRNRDQLAELKEYFRELDADYSRQLGTLASALKDLEDLNRAIPKVMVMEDRSEPRTTFMLNRGLYNQHGAEVSTDIPEFLSGFGSMNKVEGRQLSRLDLARWLVSPDNPLTARVTVNRVWQMFFGYGLCRTPEDFGSQGKPPTHPELLDWLAVEFQEQGWDMKWLVHTIVTSATYRQSAAVDSERLEKDPDNLFLSRSPRFRWPSWMIRDQALAVAGLMQNEIGGPPVYPYQPEGVWADATFGNKRYRESSGADLYRRSVYTFWRRIVGPTQFFDAAKRQVCEVKPTRTNSPLHALQTWNDPTYLEAARSLAELLPRQMDDYERFNKIYWRVLSRAPGEREMETLHQALQSSRALYANQPEAAENLIQVGASEPDTGWDPVESAAWTAVISMILNLDETLSKP